MTRPETEPKPTVDWVDWSGNRRPSEPIRQVPPAGFEEIQYQSHMA